MENLVDVFLEACESEAKCVARLSEALAQERETLIRGEIAKLEELAQAKASCLAELQALGKVRTTAMHSLNLNDEPSLNAWLADKPAALAVWETLSKELMRTQALNRVNNDLLQKRIEFVDQALAVLKNAASSTLGYGRDGVQPAGLTGGRHLGSA